MPEAPAGSARPNVPPRPGGAAKSRAAPAPRAKRRARPSPTRTGALGRRRLWLASGATAIVVVVIAALLAAYGTSASSNKGSARPAQGTFALSAATLQPLATVPAQTLLAAARAQPAAAAAPTPLPAGAPALTLSGKPEVLYIGANYCPYCAAQRWPLFMALSRFGTFTGVQGTTSSATDVNPSTPTLTFYRSQYHSAYLAFVAVETHGNIALPSGAYPVLATPTPAQASLLARWDVPPYVPAGAAGGIPFVDLGGRSVFVGSQYDASALAGLNFDRAVSQLAAGQTKTARAARAAAGYLVRDLCRLTGDLPAGTCAGAAGFGP